MDRLVDVIPLSDTLTEEQFLRDIAQTRRTVQFSSLSLSFNLKEE